MDNRVFRYQFLVLLTALCFYAVLFAQYDETAIENLIKQGDSFFNKKDYRAAKKAYETALKINKTNNIVNEKLGKVAIAEEDWNEANSRFKKVHDSDPDNIEAHYYRALCYRESGKHKIMLQRMLDWRKSTKHFEAVLARDSLYQDVLYQYALLLRYKKKYDEAIIAAQAQVHLRPELVEPEAELFRFYRYFIRQDQERDFVTLEFHRSSKDIIAWLKEQPYDQARYAIGEKYRLEGKFLQADSIFKEMIHKSLNMSKVPIYLSLVRIYYERDFSEIAEECYWRAVTEIKNDIDARLLFEDIKYIISDQDFDAYQSLQSVEDKIQFFIDFWTVRNPTPAAKVNYRLAEHYRRLNHADIFYTYYDIHPKYNDADKLGYIKYPKTYYLNQEYNDKGLVYIRYGEPDEMVVTQGADVQSNESWLYFATQETPKMMFHFAQGRYPGLWRFTPTFDDPEILQDRLLWDKIYHKIINAEEGQQAVYIDEMGAMSQKTVASALVADRHTWKKETEAFTIPVSAAVFRGENGKSNIEVYYAIPLNPFDGKLKDVTDKNFELDKGMAVYDKEMKLIDKKHDILNLQAYHDKSFIDFYRVEVPPDSYNITFNAISPKYDLIGVSKFEIKVDDFSTPSLNMSDIQLAIQIEPAENDNRFVKNNLLVVPNPSRLYFDDKPVYVYYEIYNLQKNAEGKTDFYIDYTLTLKKHRQSGFKKFLSLFGIGDQAAVTLRADRESIDEFSIEYLALDVSRNEPGEYELKITVTDRIAGKSVERKQNLNILG